MSVVVCVGLATRDTIYVVPEHPPADGRVVAEEVVVAGGGPAATAAVTLARLGVDVAFVGAVGDDDAGRFVRDGLLDEGIDLSRLEIVRGGRTPQSTILVKPDATRTIVHHPGDVTFAPVEREADWVHVDHVGFGHAAGRLSVDAGNPIPTLDLAGVALYAPTEERLRSDFGDAETALAAGAEIVAVTRGSEGSYAVTAETRIDAPPHPCDPVSTLGAGDVFHGALLAFLVRGDGLAEALRAANVAAALSCRALDGRTAIPTLEEVEWHIASQ